MPRSPELITRERAVADMSPTTAADFEMVLDHIDFPEDVTGLFILDICGGCSLATARLRTRGANAFAVDQRYGGDWKPLKRSIDTYLTNPGRYFGHDSQQFTPEELTYIRKMRQNRDTFFRYLERNQSYYVPSLAGELNFPDEYFDFCFSFHGISTALIDDYELYMQAFSEGMRVLKTGGQFQINPWFTDQGRWGINQARNASRFMQHLRGQNIEHRIESSRGIYKRLRIIKP